MRILQATRAALMTQLDIDKTLLLVRDGGPRHLAVSNVSALSATQRSLLVSERTQMLHSLSKLLYCALWPVPGLALRAPSFAAAQLGCATAPLLAETTDFCVVQHPKDGTTFPATNYGSEIRVVVSP